MSIPPKTGRGRPRLPCSGSVEAVLDALLPEGECLVWPHAKQHGYGRVDFGLGDGQRVHVLAWTFINGPVPEGKELHHTCENKGCANVEHLEALTKSEHGLRHRKLAAKRRRTTLRLPTTLTAQVEEAAASAEMAVNTWVSLAAAFALEHEELLESWRASERAKGRRVRSAERER